jgi:hypothetical protein
MFCLVKYWYHLSMLSVESSRVIWLRTIKLSSGGPPAVGEAVQIFAEKIGATGQTAMRAAQGKTPLGMTIAYRRTVRANLHRLLK